MPEAQPVVIVTGAGSASGIGFAAARAFARSGHRVVISATTARVDERAAELRDEGAAVASFVADLTDPEQAKALVAEAIEQFGRLDVLVNNAGMTSQISPEAPASIEAISVEQWHRTLQRNLDTMLFTTQAAVPVLIASGTGRIVNVASLSGPVTAYAGDIGYHAAKAGALGLTRSAAIDLAAHGITVNAVAPGWIATGSSTEHEKRMGEATPLGRPGDPEEVASLIAYLASKGASYLTGQLIVVDGGNSIMEERGALA